MNSLEIKYSLMSYFRFKRQWLCASECLLCDVMAITGKDVIDVEVKISKSDLWGGEAKKDKHRLYKNMSHFYKTYCANRFYICVPESLREEAKKWVESVNKNYGIMIYAPENYGSSILTIKTAKTLHDGSKENFKQSVMMRVCAENISLMKAKIKRRNNE